MLERRVSDLRNTARGLASGIEKNLADGFKNGFFGPIGVLGAESGGLELACGKVEALSGAEVLGWGHGAEDPQLVFVVVFVGHGCEGTQRTIYGGSVVAGRGWGERKARKERRKEKGARLPS